jgi:putative membrane protein
MKHLSDKFLSESDKEKIRGAVQAAEKTTSGEIVPMIVSVSHPYPLASVTGATAASLPLAFLFTHFIGGRFWLGHQNMWIFIAAFVVLFVVSHFLIERILGVKRIFVSDKEMDAEVQEAAFAAFYREGLYRTRDETGVLIFISVFERKVWVLADRGINEKVADDHWQIVVKHIVEGIRSKRQGDAICEAVAMIGGLLKTHFPVKPDDTDELKNLIIEE